MESPLPYCASSCRRVVLERYADHEGIGRPLGREAYGSAKSSAVRRQQRSDVVICIVGLFGGSLYCIRGAVDRQLATLIEVGWVERCSIRFSRKRSR
jgi:hypothetical protein